MKKEKNFLIHRQNSIKLFQTYAGGPSLPFSFKVADANLETTGRSGALSLLKSMSTISYPDSSMEKVRVVNGGSK